ncbi:23742_t:CDS:1, partial [Racocetra persica]
SRFATQETWQRTYPNKVILPFAYSVPCVNHFDTRESGIYGSEAYGFKEAEFTGTGSRNAYYFSRVRLSEINYIAIGHVSELPELRGK